MHIESLMSEQKLPQTNGGRKEDLRTSGEDNWCHLPT